MQVKPLETISVRGAREHNLKNFDLDIPRRAFVVITGISGSGKSSLAFDTIFSEGQRRYVESFSAYARQFLEQLEKPDCDRIEGLSPAIAIDQKSTSRNPRSTVGTVTEIYDYLRLLYARIGKITGVDGKAVDQPRTIAEISEQVLNLDANTPIHVLAPVVRGRKGIYQKELHKFHEDGFTRVSIDGKDHELSEIVADKSFRLDRQKKHDIDLYIDRLKIKPEIINRLQESLEMAFDLAGGAARIVILNQDRSKKVKTLDFYRDVDWQSLGLDAVEMEPRLFSFNSPYGACKTCNGLGYENALDPELLVPDPRKPVTENAICGIEDRFKDYFKAIFIGIVKSYKEDPEKPFNQLSKKLQKAIFEGTGDKEISYTFKDGSHRKRLTQKFEGLIPYLKKRYEETDRESVRSFIAQYMFKKQCLVCQGARLRKEALAVKVGDQSIAELCTMSIDLLLEEVKAWRFSDREQQISDRIIVELKERLQFLVDVGLSYLSLDRTMESLSGGESQRVRLATQIGSQLTGVLYVLDEPSIGLHARDNERLLNNLMRLRDQGNTVLVVEHDEETIRAADYIVDIGPGAGRLGGELVFSGKQKALISKNGQLKSSLTGQYLRGEKTIPLPKSRKESTRFLKIKGARANNLKKIDVSFPLGTFVCVTGVSGSGKSSLIKDTLYNWFKHRLYKSKTRYGQFERIDGEDEVDKVIHIDQSPIGRTPRSNPATYTGVFTHIRDLFAQLPEARMRGWKPGRFSFNVKGGRCEACQGQGMKKIEMHFLPDIFVRCEVCRGARYNQETLRVRFREKNIAEALNMTVREAVGFFEKIPLIRQKLAVLNDVGLGYITLGQSATTLSGGEAQRMKLARELSKRGTGKTLYILDEPTTGLHFADIQHLLTIFQRLTEQNNTVVVIEHHMDIIKSADYIIDLGPEGGAQGGQVVAKGQPEEVVKNAKSITGQYLKPYLA